MRGNILVLCLLMLGLWSAWSSPMTAAASQAEASAKREALPENALHLVAATCDQVRHGARLFDKNCAVCHGVTALGLKQAKLAFPADHRRCTRCHRPNNPKLRANAPSTPRNAFALGRPPALRGEGALATFPTSQALYHFIRATMPRYEPGGLSDADYAAITAFLLELDER